MAGSLATLEILHNELGVSVNRFCDLRHLNKALQLEEPENANEGHSNYLCRMVRNLLDQELTPTILGILELRVDLRQRSFDIDREFLEKRSDARKLFAVNAQHSIAHRRLLHVQIL